MFKACPQRMRPRAAPTSSIRSALQCFTAIIPDRCCHTSTQLGQGSARSIHGSHRTSAEQRSNAKHSREFRGSAVIRVQNFPNSPATLSCTAILSCLIISFCQTRRVVQRCPPLMSMIMAAEQKFRDSPEDEALLSETSNDDFHPRTPRASTSKLHTMALYLTITVQALWMLWTHYSQPHDPSIAIYCNHATPSRQTTNSTNFTQHQQQRQ